MLRLPPYIDGLIAARRAGQVGRHVHLGYWDNPPSLAAPPDVGEFECAQARLTERLLDLVPLQSGEAVLDVACGFGGTVADINTRFDGMRLTGLNIDRRQLLLCRGAVAATENRLFLVQGDACALPFADAWFDHVLCIEAMFHFTSRAKFLREAARVSRPGGILAVTDILLRRPNPGAPWDALTIERIVRRDYGPWPVPWLEVANLQRAAHAAGFDLVRKQDWSAATLPSYRTVSPLPGSARPLGAGDVFRWMHGSGWLTYAALLFRRR